MYLQVLAPGLFHWEAMSLRVGSHSGYAHRLSMISHHNVRSLRCELEDHFQHERIRHAYEACWRADCPCGTHGSTIDLKLEHY